MTLTTIQTWIAILIGAGTLLGAFFRWIIFPLWRKYNSAKRWWETFVKSIEQTTSVVNSELSPNGGNSLKDMVKKINDRLHLHDQRFRVALIDTYRAVFYTDEDGNINDVNRTFCRMLMATEEDLFGNNWVNFIMPNHKERVCRDWNSSQAYKREFVAEFDMRTSQGSKLSVYCNAFPMFDEAHEHIIGWMGFISKARVTETGSPPGFERRQTFS